MGRLLDVGRCGITLTGSPRRLVVAEERAGTNRRADGIFVRITAGCRVDVGRMWGHLARDPLRRLVVAEERPGTLGGGLDVVAVRGEAAPAPQAHRTAPYRPRYSLDQRTAGQYRWSGLREAT